MEPVRATPKDIDDYITRFPEEVQKILRKLRSTIQEAAPEAQETISYQMPAFTFHGILVHFAAFDKHIGFYPTPSGIAKFSKELSAYKGGKGSVQFPLDQPIPYDLVSRVVKFRVEENVRKAQSTRKR